MDVILQALDTVNEMFDAVRNGQAPEPATPELLATLNTLARPESQDAPAAEAVAPEPVAPAAPAEDSAPADESEDITDDEFEQLLDALDGNEPAAETSADSGLGDDGIFFDVSDEPAAEETNDEITEDEFEALLDQIHGAGKGATPAAAEEAPSNSNAPSGGDDLITDSEFEDLLDRLHGKGTNPAASTAKTAEEAAPAKRVWLGLLAGSARDCIGRLCQAHQ